MDEGEAVKRAWFALTAILRYLMTGNCGHIGCCYVEPYGFVPEAGCPVHDADTRLSRWVRKMRKGHEQSPWRVLYKRRQ